ncbi:Myb-like DNA-binding domain containing protein [Plasmodiophora brassicae]
MASTSDGVRDVLRANLACQAVVRRQVDAVGERLRWVAAMQAQVSAAAASGRRPAPPVPPAALTNQAVMQSDPFQDDDQGRVEQPPVEARRKFERIMELVPLHVESRSWTSEERTRLKHGVAHQNRVLLTRAILRDGQQMSPQEVRERLHAVRQMSLELLLANTANVDWNAIALSHVREHNAAECRLQWICNDDPRINRSEQWDEVELDALVRLAEDKYHGRHWVRVARDLGTHRTAMQCFQRYRAMQVTKRPDRSEFWTGDEDERLKLYVAEFGDSYWPHVALFLAGRTAGQCGARYQSTVEHSIRSGKWNDDEDRRLQMAVQAYGTKWARIAQHIDGRTGQKCRERYHNVFEPVAAKTRGTMFTASEDEQLIAAVDRFGLGNWSKIVAHLGKRTDSQYRRRYARIEAKRAKQAKAEPVAKPDEAVPNVQGGGSIPEEAVRAFASQLVNDDEVQHGRARAPKTTARRPGDGDHDGSDPGCAPARGKRARTSSAGGARRSRRIQQVAQRQS